MTTQPQLLKIPLTEGDVVYTPSWVAKDMVSCLPISGEVLEPCAGDGIFLRYLPPQTWFCEITQGKDFFAWNIAVDWIVGNPPYSNIKDWLSHAFDLADNVAYLIPLNSPFNSMGRLKLIADWGGIKAIRAYGNGSIFGMNYGFAVGMMWFQRRYLGPTEISVYSAPDDKQDSKP